MTAQENSKGRSIPVPHSQSVHRYLSRQLRHPGPHSESAKEVVVSIGAVFNILLQGRSLTFAPIGPSIPELGLLARVRNGKSIALSSVRVKGGAGNTLKAFSSSVFAFGTAGPTR